VPRDRASVHAMRSTQVAKVTMKSGRIVVEGRPSEAIDAEVFDLRCDVLVDPRSGTPMIVPVGRHHAGVRA